MTTLDAGRFLGILVKEDHKALEISTSLTGQYLREMEKKVVDFLRNGGVLDLSSTERMRGMLEALFLNTPLAPHTQVVYCPGESFERGSFFQTVEYFFYSSPDLGWWVRAEAVNNQILVKYTEERDQEKIGQMQRRSIRILSSRTFR